MTHIDSRMAPTYGALGSLAGVLLILFVRGASDWSTPLAWTFFGLLVGSVVLGIVSVCVAIGGKTLGPLNRALAFTAFLIPLGFVLWLLWAIAEYAKYAN